MSPTVKVMLGSAVIKKSKTAGILTLHLYRDLVGPFATLNILGSPHLEPDNTPIERIRSLLLMMVGKRGVHPPMCPLCIGKPRHPLTRKD